MLRGQARQGERAHHRPARLRACRVASWKICAEPIRSTTAAVIREIFQGSDGGRRNAILLNRQARSPPPDWPRNLEEGLAIATGTVASRKAENRLES